MRLLFGLLLLTVTASAQLVYNAKIVVEGDTPTPSAPQVIAKLAPNMEPLCYFNVFGNGTVDFRVNRRAREITPKDMDECPVTIKLAGYVTMEATLHNRAVIVLKRAGDHEGSMVSMASINAPKEARKAYEKGVAAASEKKWETAQKSFEKAIEIYPQYAQAWCYLGESLQAQSQGKAARAAWEKAIDLEPKYLKAYLQSARLALQEGRLQDVLALTDKAITMNPIEFPGIYFFNAVAHFNLKQWDAAERSARQAVENDNMHEIPAAENVLGSALVNKGDLKGALEHFRRYLEYSPGANDAAEVKKRIALIESRLEAAH